MKDECSSIVSIWIKKWKKYIRMKSVIRFVTMKISITNLHTNLLGR